MIKISVMYPYAAGLRFDHDYYRDQHLPLVKRLMGDKLVRYTIDKGVAGGVPGAPPTYVAMCHLYCASAQTFEAGFGPHVKEILADIPKYTDAQPVLQISDVVVE